MQVIKLIATISYLWPSRFTIIASLQFLTSVSRFQSIVPYRYERVAAKSYNVFRGFEPRVHVKASAAENRPTKLR